MLYIFFNTDFILVDGDGGWVIKMIKCRLLSAFPFQDSTLFVLIWPLLPFSAFIIYLLLSVFFVLPHYYSFIAAFLFHCVALIEASPAQHAGRLT